MADPQISALGELLPILLCGEESAVRAFAHHARSQKWRLQARQEFMRIELDETRHSQWLSRLQDSLPAPRADLRLRRDARQFFMRLSSPIPGIHLGRIAALDSAVCLILGRLRRSGACASDAQITRILETIHRDEARHVATARHYAREVCSRDNLFACATETRERLTTLLSSRAQEFDELEICPDALFRQLRRPPKILFT
jgi:hypothetical protein